MSDEERKLKLELKRELFIKDLLIGPIEMTDFWQHLQRHSYIQVRHSLKTCVAVK